MASTLSSRRISINEIDQYAWQTGSHQSHSTVDLPSFSRARAGERARHPQAAAAAPARHGKAAVRPLRPAHQQPAPQVVPTRETRRLPVVIRANRALRTALVAMCGLAIFGYGLDVAASNDVCKLQEQARRLNEQNSELSAQLLKAISYQGIQDSVVGRFGLHTPETVLLAKPVTPPVVPDFKPSRHGFPIMSGY